MRKLLLIITALGLAVLFFLLSSNLTDVVPVITRDNFKSYNKAQIKKTGDGLVDETMMQHQKMLPEIFVDETVYDDIEKVEIEVVPVTELNPENINQD